MLKKLFALCALISSLGAFETSNIQYLYASNFNGNAFIFDTIDGKKSTITFEHYRTFAHGDIFMFVDITRGERFDGVTHDIYAEISPRFSIADNVYVATQLNAGNDYQAYLGGLGTDLHLPLFAFVSVNLYYKSDNIFDNTYQLSTAYKSLDFHGFHIEGYVDITDHDINTQHQLLFNAASLFQSQEKIFIGTEWLFYNNVGEGDTIETNVFQAMIKYQF